MNGVSIQDDVSHHISPMSIETLSRVAQIETVMALNPQLYLETDHIIHGGVYSRTIMIPAGSKMTGTIIKVPTILIISGHGIMYSDDGAKEVSGYHVFTGSAGRKQVFSAITDTYMTMVLQTDEKTIEAVERQFTDEFDRLASHRDTNLNRISITEENACLVQL